MTFIISGSKCDQNYYWKFDESNLEVTVEFVHSSRNEQVDYTILKVDHYLFNEIPIDITNNILSNREALVEIEECCRLWYWNSGGYEKYWEKDPLDVYKNSREFYDIA